MYDFIIVGGGSAGCVLANRLSENKAARVLLLEAGPEDRTPEIAVPAAWAKLLSTPLNWGYWTEPQPKLGGRQVGWPRGRVLGGSSSLNAMIYVRGHRSDYDVWESLGNPGWGFDNVLPLFRKSEDNGRGADAFHGVDGPLPVSDLESPNTLTAAFLEACSQSGIGANPDFNGPKQDGAGMFQVTIRDGVRQSAARSFLAPARGRPNLEVVTGAHVTRVLFQGARAVGVEYVQTEQTHTAHASREVLLAGGAINSPQILMLSGIGPKRHLESLDIAVVADVPGVGQNLQDHPAIAVTSRVSEVVGFFANPQPSSNCVEAGAFLRTAADLPAPNIQFHFLPLPLVAPELQMGSFHGFTIAPTLVAPVSRGNLTLRANYPFTPPIIDPQYLEDDQDAEALLEGVRVARRVAEAAAFSRFGAKVELPAGTSDKELKKFLRDNLGTCYHPVGTCRMGTGESAVVDAQLRVRGVDGLRVVDASIMPIIPRGNTNAAVVMIAEKAAEVISSST